MASLKSVPNIPDPVDVTSPTSATSEEESIVSKVKSKVEKSTDSKYNTFDACKYIKKGSIYLIRVSVGGGQFVDVKVDYRFGKASFKSAAVTEEDSPLSF